MMILDIDGTIIGRETGNPLQYRIDLIKQVCQEIIVLTHRKEKHRFETEQLLNGIEIPYSELHMRDNDDHSNPADFKTAWLRKNLSHAWWYEASEVSMVDDNEDIARAVRSEFPTINFILVPAAN